MNLNTPVAFIIFKRPDLTQQVFNAIHQAKPKKLLVIADAPRFPEEAEECQKTKEIINTVDQDCEVLTNYSESNLGSRARISSGLNWVFSEVEEAIVLEADCLPTESFFFFCQSLLSLYRDDKRIMHIGGNNFQEYSMTPYSYFFSKYTHIWGWATWRRAWKLYDVNMKTYPIFKEANLIKDICHDLDIYEQKYWLNIFDKTYNGTIETWDYQWLYTCWIQNGLSIYPNKNLVSNIGFSPDALNTRNIHSPLANVPTFDIWDLKHPPFIVRHQVADTYTFDHVFGGKNMKKPKTFKDKISSFFSNNKRRVRLLFNDPIGFISSVLRKFISHN